MNKLLALLTLTIPAGLLGGCVDTVNVDDGRSLVLKADRRVVVTKSNPEGMRPAEKTMLASLSGDIPSQRSAATSVDTADTSGSYIGRLVCAEPSPDAISVWAASGGASVGINGQEGSIFGGRSQSAAPLGLRTGATQVLRDLEYRACEGLMNGVIGEQDYDKLMGGLPAVTLGLVAIEGITNTQAGSSVSINASAPSNSTNFTGTKEESKNGKQEKENTGTSTGSTTPDTPANKAEQTTTDTTPAADQKNKKQTNIKVKIGTGKEQDSTPKANAPPAPPAPAAPTGDKAVSPVSKEAAQAVVEIYCLSVSMSIHGHDLREKETTLRGIERIVEACKNS